MQHFIDHNDPVYIRFMGSEKWEVIRKKALATQGARCRGCGAAREELDVHHLSYRRFGGAERPWDLLVVCRPCHTHIHTPRARGWRNLAASIRAGRPRI